MLNLLTAEKIKLLPSKKIIIVLMIFFFLPIIQVVNSVVNIHFGAELSQSVDTVINGATGILMMKKNALIILLVMSAFISFYVGEEFQYGTVRNALSLGHGRIPYYITKWFITALITFISVLIMTIIGIICFSIVFGFGTLPSSNNYFLYTLQSFSTLYFLLLANVSIYVMISFIAKNSGVSLIWSFLYTIAAGFVPGVFQQTTHLKFLTYWFTESYLLYTDFVNPDVILQYSEMIVVSFITIILTTSIGILIFKVTDIK